MSTPSPLPAQKILQKIFEQHVLWEAAERYAHVYKDAKKSVSGNAECRRIGRMKIVLERFLEEVCETVEAAERESV